MNYAAKNYGSEYIVISNPDVRVEERAILNAVCYLKKNRDTAIVAPYMKNSNGEEEKQTAWRIPDNKWEFVLSDTSIILNKEVKTAKSFKAVLDTFQTVKSKEYNVLVLADSYLNNLRLEFGEYVKCDEIIDVSSIVSKRMKDIVSNVGRIKKKGIILTKLSKEDFMKQAYWLDIKVKFMTLE